MSCADDAADAPADPGNPVESSRVAYGDDPLQFGDLTVPAGDGAGPFPVVVFIHGGFWRNSFGLDLAQPQAADAVANGFAAWNIEYRRVGDLGGGYPGTLLDVAAAVDHLAVLADEHRLDLDRVAVVGHSAGGHLALWVGQRANIGAGSPGADPIVVPQLVVGQAPVADLAGNLDLGGGAVLDLMGATPDDAPDAYATADPVALLPVLVDQLIVQGGADTIVPPGRVSSYEATVADPQRLEVVVFPEADHFDVIDPSHESWPLTRNRIAEAFG